MQAAGQDALTCGVAQLKPHTAQYSTLHGLSALRLGRCMCIFCTMAYAAVCTTSLHHRTQLSCQICESKDSWLAWRAKALGICLLHTQKRLQKSPSSNSPAQPPRLRAAARVTDLPAPPHRRTDAPTHPAHLGKRKIRKCTLAHPCGAIRLSLSEQGDRGPALAHRLGTSWRPRERLSATRTGRRA